MRLAWAKQSSEVNQIESVLMELITHWGKQAELVPDDKCREAGSYEAGSHGGRRKPLR